MEIIGVHHMAIITDNVARLREFYVDVLGLPIVGGFAGRAIIFIGVGGTAIELVERSARPTGGGGWDHLALEVPDIDAAYAELTARGVPFHLAPKAFPPEAPTVRIAFFKDPDGNVLELVQPLGARYPARDKQP